MIRNRQMEAIGTDMDRHRRMRVGCADKWQFGGWEVKSSLAPGTSAYVVYL